MWNKAMKTPCGRLWPPSDLCLWASMLLMSPSSSISQVNSLLPPLQKHSYQPCWNNQRRPAPKPATYAGLAGDQSTARPAYVVFWCWVSMLFFPAGKLSRFCYPLEFIHMTVLSAFMCNSRNVWWARLQQHRLGPRCAGCGLRQWQRKRLLAGQEQVRWEKNASPKMSTK